jgi:hypothetical protein
MAAVPENVLKKTRRAEEWAAQRAAQAQEVRDDCESCDEAYDATQPLIILEICQQFFCKPPICIIRFKSRAMPHDENGVYLFAGCYQAEVAEEGYFQAGRAVCCGI